VQVRFSVLIPVTLAASVLFGCDSGTNTPQEITATGQPGYVVEGRAVPLNSGVYVGEDGTVSLLESVHGDLNGDETDDFAAIFYLDSKGSGRFYYLNVFLANEEGQLNLVGEEFLGDRIKLDFLAIYGEASISPLTGIAIHPDDYGQLAIAYSTHADDQSYAEEPALFLTRHWKVSDGQLVVLENY
jgi:hypothetical protein